MDETSTGIAPGRQYLDSLHYAPPTAINTSAPPGGLSPYGVAPTQAAQPSSPQFPALVQQAEAGKKGKLTPEELSNLWETTKTRDIAPMFWSQRGATQGSVAANLASFDAGFEEFAKQYNAQAAAQLGTAGPAAPKPLDQGGIGGYVGAGANLLRDVPLGVAGGAAKALLATAPTLLDYGIRNVKAVAATLAGYPELVRSAMSGHAQAGADKLNEARKQALGEQTIFGRGASAIETGTDKIVRSLSSDRTNAQTDEIGKVIADPKSTIGDVAGAIVTNPMGSVQQVGNIVGAFAGPGALLRMKEGAAAIEALSPFMRKLVGAHFIGGPQALSGTRQWEDHVRAKPVAELRKDPANDEVFKQLKELGASDEVAGNAVYNHAIATGAPAAAATQYIANVTLEALPFGSTVEQRFARLVKPAEGSSLARRAIGSAQEAAQETASQVVQTGGENVATNIATGSQTPVGEGVPQAATQAGILAAVTGGLMHGGHAPSAEPAPDTTTTDTTTTDTTGAPTATATVPTGPTFSATPAPNFEEAILPAITAAVTEDNKITKLAKSQASTAAELIPLAQRVAASKSAEAGTPWTALDQEQQSTLIEHVAELMNKARGPKRFKDLGEVIVAWKNPTPPAAPEAPQAPTAAPTAEAPAPVPPPPVAPEATPEEAQATIAAATQEAAALSEADRKAALDKTLIEQHNVSPELLKQLNAEQTQNYLNSLVTQAPVVTTTQEPSIKPKKTLNAKENKARERAIYLDRYLKAIMNEGQSTGVAEDTIRADPLFNEARSQLKAGKITSPAELEAFLNTKPAAPATVAKPAAEATSENVPLGAALNTKGASKNAVAIKRLARGMLDQLISKGIAADKAKLMTFAQAKYTLSQLEDVKPEAPKKNGLKKPKPVAAAATPAPTQTAKLPQELAGAKPRYSYGEKQFELNFANDTDRALFIVSQKTKSKSDAKYRKFLTDNGLTEDEINTRGQEVRNRIKEMAKNGKGGTTLQIGETQSPKPQAPAQTGAADLNAQNPQPNNQPNTYEGSDVEVRVSSILNDSAVDSYTESEIVEAIVAGEGKKVATLVNQAVRDGDMTPEQGRKLKDFAKTTPQEVPNDHSADVNVSTENPTTRALVDSALESDSPTAAEDLLLAMSTQTDLRSEQKWLARKLAGMVSALGVKLVSPDSRYAWAGGYSHKGNSVWIRRANPTVVLHEFVHSVTANLLEYKAGLKGNAQLRRIAGELDIIRNHILRHIARNPDALESFGLTEKQIAPTLANTKELVAYAMTERGFQEFLDSIPPPITRRSVRSVWQAFKDTVASIFKGITPQQRSTLDAVIETTGELIDFAEDNTTIAKMANAAASEGSLQIAPSLADLSNVERMKAWVNTPATKRNFHGFMENLVDKTFAIEKEVRRIVKAGGKLTPENNPMDAIVRFDGIRNDTLATDEGAVGTRVYNWFTDNWQRVGKNRRDAVKNVNDFLYNRHVIERAKVLWLMKVKLGGGMAFDREELIEKMRDGDIIPKDARKQLEQLVAQHREQTFEEYAKKRIDLDAINQELQRLNKLGVNEKSLADLNNRMQAVRDRTRERNTEAGFVSENDPYIDFYNFKWYVPLKGTPNAEHDAELADLDQEGNLGRAALARLNKQIETMGGTKKIAETPLEQLLVDMSLAGRRKAENHLTDTFAKFIQDNKKLFPNLRVSVFEGWPKGGYKQLSGPMKKLKGQKGKNKEFFRKLPAITDGFIHHEGDRHYVYQLDQNSLLLRGILGMSSEVEPNFFSKTVGKATNVLSKLYTTMNPIWQTTVALPRDLTYAPIMIALQHTGNPLTGTMLAAKYVKNLASNAFQLNNLPVAIDMIINDRAKLNSFVKDNPNSWAAWLTRLEKAGGSTNFFAWANHETLGKKLEGTFDKATGVWVVAKPYKVYEKITSNYASILENVGRVAAFKTLMESVNPKTGKPYTDHEAAAIVKGYLNFDQKGRRSRSVNSYLAFFKVGMTGADAIRKSFIKADGSFDIKKFAAYSLYFAALGFAKYKWDDELMGEDENGENNLKKVSLDTLTQGALIPMGDRTYKFNYGLGLPQILMAPGIIAAAVMSGHKTPSEAVRGYYEMLGRNAPVRPAGLPQDWGISDLVKSWTTGSLIPTAVAPVIGIAENRDAFGRPIHTEFKNPDKYESEQAKSSTAPEWTDVATWLRENLNIDAYPEDTKYLIRNYGGQISSVVMGLTVDAKSDSREGAPQSDIIGRVGKLEVMDEKFYMGRQVSNTLATLGDVKKRADAIKSKAARDGTNPDAALREWSATVPHATAQIAAYEALEKANSQYYKDLRTIRNNRLMSTEGKRLKRKQLDTKFRAVLEKAQKVAPE
jgi:hypothetical protein